MVIYFTGNILGKRILYREKWNHFISSINLAKPAILTSANPEGQIFQAPPDCRGFWVGDISPRVMPREDIKNKV